MRAVKSIVLSVGWADKWRELWVYILDGERGECRKLGGVVLSVERGEEVTVDILIAPR